MLKLTTKDLTRGLIERNDYLFTLICSGKSCSVRPSESVKIFGTTKRYCLRKGSTCIYSVATATRITGFELPNSGRCHESKSCPILVRIYGTERDKYLRFSEDEASTLETMARALVMYEPTKWARPKPLKGRIGNFDKLFFPCRYSLETFKNWMMISPR